ncbi:Protein MON2 [Dirofilaria immitis]
MITRLRSWVTWSWTYLWALWFLLVIALVYILRGPLHITESLESAWHEVSVYPKRDLPFFTVLTALLFFITIVLAIATHQYPKHSEFAQLLKDQVCPLIIKLFAPNHKQMQILFPMLDKVRALTLSASTTRTGTSALGASNILIHHSRDTESKQWAETSVQTLSGVVKIFNAQRALLLTLVHLKLLNFK